ncbi:putative histone-lysine N-methyltransferase ATXR3 [Acorus calamus]|uniref:Histone-lysine N-methyltransferase ATXR3 n=1 Tax=Acorus calamus TaxID=4465 RepID=A0AAV9DVT5_ACOCL|nr:putative histone-lysine N-methyltransferase ATXR3 [Acorus calamus]
MGDGGVACIPSQHVMERFPVPEASAFCVVGSGGFPSKHRLHEKPDKKTEVEKGMGGTSEKARRVEKGVSVYKKGELEKGEFVPEKTRKGELEKGELFPDRFRKGELEKGEFIPERTHKGELEKGEFVPERSHRGELEKGEFVPESTRNGDLEKGEFVPERRRRLELEKGEFVPELEKGVFVPEKWRRAERERPDFAPWRGRKMELEKIEVIPDKRSSPKPRKGEWERSPKKGKNHPPPVSRLVDDDRERRKRSSSKLENGSDESGPHKHDQSNGKTPWLKPHGVDSDSGDRKHHGDIRDHSGSSKSRRILEDVHGNHRLRGSPDRSHKNLSSRISSNGSIASIGNRHPSRHHEPSPTSRGGAYDRHAERSLHDRGTRHSDHRERSPGRNRDHRDHTPSYSDRSPHDRARYPDRKDRSSGHPERSPHERSRPTDSRDSNRKNGAGRQGKQERKDSGGRDSQKSSSNGPSSHSEISRHLELSADNHPHKEKQLQGLNIDIDKPLPPPPPLPLPPPVSNDTIEELPSMEEDMDICDTPPHVMATTDQTLGKWFYLDSFGMDQGPSKLCDLKRFVEEGLLQSDHLIKHSEGDRWVTIENATSPLVTMSLTPVVSEMVTEMASPPEAPGNLSTDVAADLESSTPLLQSDDVGVDSELLVDLQIDERVSALLDGCDIIPGRELETLGEILNLKFEHVEWEKWDNSEDFTRFRARSAEVSRYSRNEEFCRASENIAREGVETRLAAPFDKEFASLNSGSSDWFAGRWSCKGGDWKRNDEVAVQDRTYRRKLVLNEGFPICQMPKSGYEDPRWHIKDDLYHPSRPKKLDMPPWAFAFADEKNDGSVDAKAILGGRQGQVKPLIPKGVKGNMLPVVRINACVVADQGSLGSESRPKARSHERHALRSTRSYSSSSDHRSPFPDTTPRPVKAQEHDLQSLFKCRDSINIPKDHVCTVDELALTLGDWYYLDGAGHEIGPSSFLELQALAAKGSIPQHSSVFRKFDKLWVPISSDATSSKESHFREERVENASDSSISFPMDSQDACMPKVASFHDSFPQFIGYTRGRLHELVMKSFKSREFAATINEVLDPWMTAKQPKKDIDKHFSFSSSVIKSAIVPGHDSARHGFWISENDTDNIHTEKRARLMVNESDDYYDMEDDLLIGNKNDSFDELCGEVTFEAENIPSSHSESEEWGLLDGHVLARVFHFLRTDVRALVSSAATCKHWKSAIKFYKDISRHIDLSSAGPECTDSIFWSIISGYDKTKITYVVLKGCTSVSATAVEEMLQSFPCISYVNIKGCDHLRELMDTFHNVKWITGHSLHHSKNIEESQLKMKSLKQITEKGYLMSKAYKGSSTGEPGVVAEHDPSSERKASSTFKHGCYKRTKIPDAKKSSALTSRDAQMRLWLRRKSADSYRKLEEYIANSLKDIMKENAFAFFIPKVAAIEDRMRNGHYFRHGLSSVKDDIRRMCRDALKEKNLGGSGNMNQVILSFIEMARSLEDNSKLSYRKMLKDSSGVGFCSGSSKLKYKQNKMNERKSITRTNSASVVNDAPGTSDCASDREIRRRLSKLNKRGMESGSDTSDGSDFSEEESRRGHPSSDSETESDLDIRSEGRALDIKRDDHYIAEPLESVAEEREWGARMTKASLVPPVTRKYEVIDQYVVVADEEEVKRKMRVSLPEDYAEKLSAQKNNMEESEMEIPEVKDYKPRKQVGDEVLEQEVYGIDPYTHNLLLDSMPEEWPLVDKHKFIEDALLRCMNKQVRHFTGIGNAPMVYPLRLVVEEVQRTADESGDTRTLRLCKAILKAMMSRPDDNYVAYRKGLGVVCNKEEGFVEDDFVVEFLGEVYPIWKWYEKQDGIRALQKNSKDPAPEFYNIQLERPKGDRDGYDLVMVDAMHKANFASRICHSCRPNCEAKVTAVDGQYQIGIYTVRPIAYGEEVTFDYNSVTESKEEYEASVCLCGSQVCRGSYLNLTGEEAFQMVLKESHGLLDRHKLMLEACEKNYVSEEDYIDLAGAGLGPCLLDGLPDWLVAYSAGLVRFINLERTKLPGEILEHNLEEKKKFFSEICIEIERSEAEIQAEGVYNQRLQSMATTIDKVRYVMRSIFKDPKKSPPPLVRLSPESVVSMVWKGEGSLVEDLLQCMAPHMETDLLDELRSNISAHDPCGSDLQGDLRKSLLWLRDELRNLPCSYKCRHDAAADLIHMYAYTKSFFKVREYRSMTSPPVYISPLDMGPKYTNKLGTGFQEYCKTYGENYCLGQLIYWHNLTCAEPDSKLARARRGCLLLPDISSFYAKSQKPLGELVYGQRTLRFILSKMEKQPQRPWPKDRIWAFKSAPKILGSPMMDAVLNNCPLDREMLQWLRSRPSVFQAAWDE